MPSKNILLIIDPQIDFHEEGGSGKSYHPQGSLAVPGANEDSTRVSLMILNHLDEIDSIYVTLDSHHRNHIAHGIFWENEKGESPVPFTLITNDDVIKGIWLPKNRKLLQHCIFYTSQLQKNGRFTLIIWPEHCLMGSIGHAVVPEIHFALQEWCGRTGKTINYVMKGENCLTEMYSAIGADVEIDDPRTKKNPILLAELLSGDQLIVCGQALSHCVAFTVRDIVKDHKKVSSIKVLIDACSPVGGFKAQADEFVQEVQAQGVVITTTDQVFRL